MRRTPTLGLIIVILASTSSFGQAPLRLRIDSISAEIHSEMIRIRRDIHMHPELSNREVRTGQLVADYLRKLGLDQVTHPVAKTGVVALLKGGRPGPVVAVRADMDALPIQEMIDVPYKSTVAGVKHACGHDGHVAIGLGVATILSRMRAEIAGTVKFLFQPAEEGPPEGETGGAPLMIAEGALKNPDVEAIFGLHLLPTIPVGQIGFNSGAAMASSNVFDIEIVGKKTHGAYPHTGIDPIPIAAQVILALQTIPSRMNNASDPIVISVGVVEAGNRFNIIADKARLVGTVRTLRRGGPEWVRDRIEAVLKGVTSSYGASYRLQFKEGNPVTYNDPALAARMVPVLERVVGASNLTTPPPQMGAEDFSKFQLVVPGFFFFVGVANPSKGITAMIHTEYYDMDEDALRIGARALSNVVLEYSEGKKK